MKKNPFLNVFAIVMAMLCFAFVSCSSDDDDESGSGSTPSALVGIWVQYHTSGATAYYYGMRLDSNGNAYYTEWDSKRTANWGSPGKWNATSKTINVNDPKGNLVYSSDYTLTDGGNTIVLEGDKTGGHFGTMSGEFKKQK